MIAPVLFSTDSRSGMASHPTLIVIGGFAGAGKSTLALEIGKRMGIPVFEIDQMARSIRESPDFRGGQREHYGIAFDLFFSMARRLLENRCSIILDQNMGHAVIWENVERLIASIENFDLRIFILDCPFEVCLERVDQRSMHPNYKEVTAETVREHKYKWDFLEKNDFPSAARILLVEQRMVGRAHGRTNRRKILDECREEGDRLRHFASAEWNASGGQSD